MANALSLPVDVAWTRFAIYPDMYATSITADLPLKWNPSLAVYRYDPEPDPEDDSAELTTFLKLVVSITGFNINFSSDQTKGYYMPAVCAMAQVAVFPQDGEWNVNEYPYFADLQPKQRELVEMRTESSEYLTRSTDPLSVSKLSATAEDQQFSPPNSDVPPSRFTSGLAFERVFTDASREKRETTSYTTNVAQLYHILDTYHTGTNRAIFLMTARPHLIDSGYTFVNGPRALEGIQEFFLLVKRPKTMKAISVKAVLETANLMRGERLGVQGDAILIVNSTVTGPALSINQVSSLYSAVYEEKLTGRAKSLANTAKESGKSAVVAANALGRELRNMFVASYSSALRYPAGQVDVTETNVAMEAILAARSDTEDGATTRQLVQEVHRQLGEPARRLSSADLDSRRRLLRALRVRTS